jgi:chromodomain-helicase-DNA-binding protein 4
LSVEEVCAQLDLKDTNFEYEESHYQSLVTYKMFTQFMRPILQKENPKAASSKLMMLVAAKWREFCEENPSFKEPEEENEEEDAEKSAEEKEASSEEEEPLESEYQPKPSRSRGTKAVEKRVEAEESDDDDKRNKKRSTTRSSKRGKKQKVPTLKIRFGKKKDASSDEEKVRIDNECQYYS